MCVGDRETPIQREFYGIPLDQATVAVQGFGSVGANAARLLDEWGATIVAVSDVNGAAYDPTGVETATIPSHDEQPEAVTTHADTTISNEELLELDVDLLIPAAIGNVITESNAGSVHARVIVEGANGPITSVADAILTSRGIPVIPDILANAGGGRDRQLLRVAAGHQPSAWSRGRVNAELEEEILSAWRELRREVEDRGVTWRDAAYIVALSRLADAHEHRGLWP